MTYQPILGTLGYVLSKDKKQTLLVHRNKREDDQHLGKYNGLGGKMEVYEDALSCIKREIKEEADIDCLSIKMRGTINWTGFGPNGENWLGFIFLIDEYSGTPLDSNIEGTLEWINLENLSELPMWEGDRHFLPLVFDNTPQLFHGYMPYEDGKPLGWSFSRE